MNDEIRENISCPQFGDNHYGKWGALNLEQRKKIKDLLNKIDNLKIIEKKYIQLQSNWNSLREWLEVRKELYNSSIKDEYKVILDKMNELEKRSENWKY